MGASSACLCLAARQFGLVSGAQARQAGLSVHAIERRVRSGLWQHVLPGVYRIGGAPRMWEQDLLAACLWIGGTAVASHRSAAALWQMRGFEPRIIEVSGRKRVAREGVTVHHTLVRESSKTVVADIPVTTASRTLVDLGAVVPSCRVEDALDDALRRGLVSLAEMRTLVERDGGKGRRGIGVLRKILDQRPADAAPTESPLEGRVLRLIVGAGLPRPETQFEVWDRGALVARVDLAYPDALLAIEVDGYAWHSGRSDWQRDLRRRNRLTAMGWKVLHFTAADIRERSGELVGAIRASLLKNLRAAQHFQ